MRITIRFTIWVFLLVAITHSAYGLGKPESKIRLALFKDHGAHIHQPLIDSLFGNKNISTTIVDGEDIRNGCLSKFDVLFIPGGSGKQESFSLEQNGRSEICNFVRNGGIYIGVCAGCYLASSARSQYLGLLPLTTADKEHWRRGKAILPIEFNAFGMEVFKPGQHKVKVIYHNGPIFKADNIEAKGVEPLSYFRGEITAPKGKKGVMLNAPAMVLEKYGNGLVLGISPHPEATPGLEQLELNAIDWLYTHRSASINHSLDSISSNLTSPNIITSKNLSPIVPNPPNQLSQRIYNKAEEIFEHTTSSHYEHLHEGVKEQVQRINNSYESTTDCSGFVSYVIDSVAPKHYAALREMTLFDYPHAKIFATFFRELSADTPTDGWLKINSYKDLRRGDIIAWEKPADPVNPHLHHKNTGHVMIVIDSPTKPTSENVNGNILRFTEVNVLDSSSVEHFPPQLLPPLAHQTHRDGIGKGMIRLLIDNDEEVIGYWEGTYSGEKKEAIKGPTYTDKVSFARLIPLSSQ